MLAAKAALGVRIDGAAANAEVEDGAPEPTEEERSALGTSARRYIESRLRKLEGKPLKGFAQIAPSGQLLPTGGAKQPGKWEVKEARKYNIDADGLTGDEPAATAAKGKKPLIEEVETNGDAGAGANEDEDEDEEMELADEEDQEEEEEAPGVKSESTVTLNGASDAKAEKAVRKAAKEEKRRLKEEKRARKEAKKAAKAEKSEREGGRKRKHDGEEKGEKKKKKHKS